MERALVQDPAPEHPLDGWFEPAVAARLAAAGLTTLADLLALIQRRRHRWYTAEPRLGPKGAQRITDWLDLHARPLHCILSPLATTPRRQFAVGHPVLTRPAVSADVAPLESLRVPPELDGSQGLNRAPMPAHQAELATDLDAVNAWIAIRGERSAHTARAYRREAERLLLWAIIVRRKLDAALEDAWTLRVMGKGRRARQVPMPHRLMEALAASLLLRPTACTFETAPAGTPLIAHLKTGKSLSPDALARLYKAIFKRAADALASTYPGAAADLKRASTHWLRHTHANHALDASSDLRDVQTGLGHASLGTTTLYTKGDAARQYRAVERFFDAALEDGAAASPV